VRRWLVLRRGETTPTLPGGQLTVPTALALGTALLVPTAALRAWMLYPSWFYADDLRLLAEASSSPFTLGHLLAPYDSQFMPGGRALAWFVAHAGVVPADWGLAATITLGLWLLSGFACLWMLLELFGPRWGVLGLLGLHATTALTAPATMWWAASLNQLPLLVVWYAAVAAWTRHLRSGSRRWLGATLTLLALGTLFYVKTVLVLPVLVVLLLGWFVPGGPVQKVRHTLQDHWPALAILGTATIGFALFYRSHVPQPFTRRPTSDLAVRLAGELLGRDFAPLALGGPWRWAPDNPPVSVVDPPVWLLAGAGLVVAATVGLLVVRRRLGGLLVVFLGLAGAYALLLTTRAPYLGPVVGREPRYLTETVCALVLGMGLATMSVRGGTHHTGKQDRLRAGPAVPALLTTLVCISGAVSSMLYAQVWHTSNPIDAYLNRFALDSTRTGKVTVADVELPPDMSLYVHPYNTLAVLAPLVTDSTTFPDVTDRLAVPDGQGGIHVAVIDPSAHGVPGGTPGCGWQVGDRGRTIPLDAPLADFDWWVRVPYLASRSSPIRIAVAGTAHRSTIGPGLGSVFVHHKGTLDAVRIDGLEESTQMCVGRIEVGVPQPGGPLDVG